VTQGLLRYQSFFSPRADSTPPAPVPVAVIAPAPLTVEQALRQMFDQDNKIEASQKLLLPRPNWRIKAAGPLGMDNLLVMVAAGPRDLGPLAANKAGPFVSSLNDAQGQAKLVTLMSSSQTVTSQACANSGTRRNNALCSDAYGASMVAMEEIK